MMQTPPNKPTVNNRRTVFLKRAVLVRARSISERPSPLRQMHSAVLLVVALVLTGCGTPVDPQVLKIREQFLSEQPKGSETPVAEIRKAMQSGDLKPDTSFTIRVRINAGEISPFSNGTARFFVTDATGHDGDEEHDPHECPFCRRDVKSMMALVEFKDASEKVLQIDARELFDFKEFDLLVLEGKGHLDEEEILVISASRMSLIR